MYRVIVPTLNAARDWHLFAPALAACVEPEYVLIVDSASTDGTLELARAAGFQVCSVAREEFNHGATRQMAAELLPNAEVLVFMTQDSILVEPQSLSKLVSVFSDPEIGAACGRQLPRPQATPIEAHARYFNYPAKPELRTFECRKQLGIRAAFLSNSLAAYRRSALMEVGGFPGDTIFGEDMVAAARLLKAGYKVAYVAEACTYHSHSYTKIEEFKRYFDIGVLHSRERWLIDEFGKTHGEGKRFVFSELRYLRERDAMQIPSALARTTLKLLGYRLGRLEARLPSSLKRRLSLHSTFWT